jgi:hypothetical protein
MKKLLSMLVAVFFIGVAVSVLAGDKVTGIWTSPDVPGHLIIIAQNGNEEIYSPWMSGKEYQEEFDRQNRQGFYPKQVEGREYNGKIEFRAIFIKYLRGNLSFYTHHGLPETEYDRKNKEYTLKGFTRIWHQEFMASSGQNLHQGTWTRTQFNAPPPQPPQKTASSFQSVNYPDRFIRHKGFMGYIDPIQSDLDRSDASFLLVPGLADKRYFSFRSVNYPDHYLRHQNFELKLHKPDGSDLFRNDATFRIVQALYGEGGVSFESVNYPGYYIRHQNFRLYIHRMDGSELFRKDATFIQKPGLSF